MKHRSVVAVICFSIITLGVYDLFWLASTKKELNARTRIHVPSLWLLFSPLLALVAVALLQLLVHAASSGSGSSSYVTAVVSIVLILIGIAGAVGILIMPIIWFLKYSKAVGEYTSNSISTAVAFLLLWLLRFVGIAVIQDHYNDMLAAGGAVMQNQNPAMTGAMPPAQPQYPINPAPSANPVPPSQSGNQPGSQNNQRPPLVQ